MMAQIVLIRGIPGSGKSTQARQFVERGYLHFENDDFFIHDGQYVYDATLAEVAAAQCFSKTAYALKAGKMVVVANTFLSITELWPYIDLAQRENYSYAIEQADGRFKNIHGVLPARVESMEKKIESIDGQTFKKSSQAQLARLFSVSRQAINDLVKRGIIVVDADGLIDIQKARQALAVIRPSAKTASAAINIDPPASQAEDPNSAVMSFHVAKTLREVAEAQMARIKLAEMQSKYLDKSEVDSAIFEIARALRDGLTNCARRIAADVAALGSAEDCEAVIDREHRALLDSMTHRISSKLGTSMAGAGA